MRVNMSKYKYGFSSPKQKKSEKENSLSPKVLALKPMSPIKPILLKSIVLNQNDQNSPDRQKVVSSSRAIADAEKECTPKRYSQTQRKKRRQREKCQKRLGSMIQDASTNKIADNAPLFSEQLEVSLPDHFKSGIEPAEKNIFQTVFQLKPI